MKRMGILSFACAAALTVACNGNATNQATTDQNRDAVGTSGEAADAERDATALHESDREFIQHVLMGGMAEVQLGRMAAERASSPDVKRFGQMMVTDHTKAGDQLKQIAAQYNVAAPTQLDEKHQDLMHKLSTLRGADFDRAYIDAMVDDHEEDVDALESRVDTNASLKDQITNAPSKDTSVTPERGDNHAQASVNAWAAQTLPTLRHHLDEAKRIDESLDRSANRNDTASRSTQGGIQGAR